MIEEILKKQLSFEGADNTAKFVSMFTSLYRIELFKDGLDLVLTKVREGDLKFNVKIIKGWDTNEGCCLTSQNKVYNKVLKAFTNKYSHKITIRSFQVNVMAHEMAHALGIESGLIITEDFRKAVAMDMKDRKPGNIALASAIKRIMVDGVKSYPADKIMTELFARYFELLSLSRNVSLSGDFLTKDVMDFFINTTNWFTKIFNEKIKPQIDLDIAKYSAEQISKDAFKGEKKFTEKVDSFYKRVDDKKQKSFSANTKSNSAWQKSWNSHEQQLLQNNKDKKN